MKNATIFLLGVFLLLGLNINACPQIFETKENETLSQNNRNNTDSSNNFKDTIFFPTQSLYSIVGTSIGINSMHTVDINKDGIKDLICSASNYSLGGGSNFWYIMNYSPETKNYSIVWNSTLFENTITTLEVFDINDDGSYEVLIGLGNGKIQIYDALSKELKNEAIISYDGIKSIDYADADNDSQKEIIVASSNTYILDASTLNLKLSLNIGSNVAKVGNIDDNEQNELILSSGLIYRITNGSFANVGEFNIGSGGKMTLADVDNDSKEEIIFSNQWYKINVVDAELNQTKYTIDAKQNISTVYVTDIDDDGTKEIIYGDGQWGEIHCFNSQTQKENWSAKNPQHGVDAINIADLDNDGKKELIWTAGRSSSGSNNLFIYDIENKQTEWQSKYIFGPFYTVKTGDLNGDKIDDIVSITYRGEGKYSNKVVVAIDGRTRKVLWESDFSISPDESVDDILITDLNKDGFGEIIIPTNWGSTLFYIINGKDFKVKTVDAEYPVDDVQSILCDDINNDGNLELICANVARIYIIDPNTGELFYNIALPSIYLECPQAFIECGDVTGNEKKEIVLCTGPITIVNMSNKSMVQTQENDFVNIDLFDYNNDGRADIIGCTEMGEIRVLDGKTMEYIAMLKPENTRIETIKAIRYQNDVVFVYSCEGRINYYINDNKRIVSQDFGTDCAKKKGLQLLETTNGKDLIFGNNMSIQAVSGKYFACTALEIGIEKNEVSCDLADGYIKIDVKGSNTPITYSWNNYSAEDSLSGLIAGLYTVKVSNDAGCYKTRRINLINAYLDIQPLVTHLNCKTKGAVELKVNHINEPFSINWSNKNSSLNNTNLNAGTYSINIVDAKNCKFNQDFVVRGDTINVKQYIKQVSCFGKEDGYISLQPTNYYGSFQYKWNNGSNFEFASNLAAGTYQVNIKDIYNCSTQMEFTITQPNEITYNISTLPDSSSTQINEGEAIIKNIEGGTPPYIVFWPNSSIYNDTLSKLPIGLYKFIISDAKNCTISDSVAIDFLKVSVKQLDNDRFKIYPNPANNSVFVQIDKSQIAQNITIVNSLGQEVKHQTLFSELNQIDVSNLTSGVYIIGIQQGNRFKYSSLIIGQNR